MAVPRAKKPRFFSENPRKPRRQPEVPARVVVNYAERDREGQPEPFAWTLSATVPAAGRNALLGELHAPAAFQAVLERALKAHLARHKRDRAIVARLVLDAGDALEARLKDAGPKTVRRRPSASRRTGQVPDMTKTEPTPDWFLAPDGLRILSGHRYTRGDPESVADFAPDREIMAVVDEDECKVNARLAAAAPDLAAALDEALGRLKDALAYVPEDGDAERDLRDAADDAINKGASALKKARRVSALKAAGGDA